MSHALPQAVPLQVASGEVHCWSVNLNTPPETSAALYATLTRDERDRCARLPFEPDRRRFIVARGVLRDLLGRYLGAPPGDIRFAYNPFGKPGLDPAFGSRLRFNLSHSGLLALIAFAAGAEIGIDLEELRAQPDFTEIARQFFSAAEIEGLNRVPSSLQSRAFLGCWTKKEAFVKACGQGLTMSMRDFSVPLTTDPGEPPADLFVSSTENLPGRRWSIHTLHPATGYIGAIAVEGRGLRLRHCHWQVTRERVTSGGGLELVSG